MKDMAENSQFSYDVFLSYRHKPRDNRICKKTHTLLETFKPPRKYKKSDIKRVFRDNEELPAAGVLSDTIGDALRSARVLLVICSKDTPESQWVDKEVRTFIELGRSDKIYALLLDNDPAVCFPHSLRLVPGIDSRTIRIASGSERQMIKNLKKQLLRVVASATETPYDPLRLAVRNRKITRSILAGAFLSLFLFASGLYSLYQWSKASYYNLYAQREEILIHDIIHRISFGLTDSVESLPGADEALVKILSDNIDYLDRIMEIGGPSDKALTDKGNNYLNLVRVNMLQGDTLKAKENSKKAVRIFEDLRKSTTDSVMADKLAITYNLAGLFMQTLSEYEDAVFYLTKASVVYKELEDANPHEDYRKSQADCLNGIATCLYYMEDYLGAADAYIKETSLLRDIFGNSPTVDERVLLADLTSVTGSCLFNAREYERSVRYNTEAVKQYEEILKQNSDTNTQKSYAISLYSLAMNLAFIKDDKSAEYYLRLSLVEADKLVSSSLPEFDPIYLAMYAMYDMLYADEAKKAEALSLSSEAFESSSGDVFVSTVHAYALLFNGYLDETAELLQSLINDNKLKLESIEDDLTLFNLRGRASDEVSQLRKLLSDQ